MAVAYSLTLQPRQKRNSSIQQAEELHVETAYWIVAGLTAALFLFTGGFKLALSKDALREKGMEWTVDFTPNGVRGIGIAEILGAIGLIVPPLTGIAPWLAPVAALGLVIIMLGAIRAHRKRGGSIAPNIVFGLLALAAAVLGFIVWL